MNLGGLVAKTGVFQAFSAVMYCITTVTPITRRNRLFLASLPPSFVDLEDANVRLTRPNRVSDAENHPFCTTIIRR